MFMLRCCFWLSVMFATLPLGAGAVATSTWSRGQGVADAAAVVADKVGDWCAAHRDRCARDAARLTALVAASAADDEADDRGQGAVQRAASPARHRAAKAMLTSAH